MADVPEATGPGFQTSDKQTFDAVRHGGGVSDDHVMDPTLTESGLSLPLDSEPVHAPDSCVITPEDYEALALVDEEMNTRWSETTIDPTLRRMDRLMDLLGHPERSFPSIHVAGTNGKTTTVRMIESLLRAFHRRTGRTTSPHLQLVTERIGIDGTPIHPRDYVRYWEEIKPYVEMVDQESVAAGGPRMSKFECMTALAFAAFADAPVDVAVVEVGMGGTWDATNVIDSDVSVIMPIGLDHTDYLGDTIEKIATEKAGIMKKRRIDDESDVLALKNGITIVAEQTPEANYVILTRSVQVDAIVARAGTEFKVVHHALAVGGQQVTIQGLAGEYPDIFLPLHGEYQAHNAACALAAVEAFFGAGVGRQLDIDTVREGFATVTSPGRLERVSATPTVFVDATHNPHGAKALGEALERDFTFRRLIAVVGILADKDAEGILTALEPHVAEIVCTQSTSPRAIEADELARRAIPIFGDDRVHTVADLKGAMELATELVEDTLEPDEPASGCGIIITGSITVAGQARALCGKEPA